MKMKEVLRPENETIKEVFYQRTAFAPDKLIVVTDKAVYIEEKD